MVQKNLKINTCIFFFLEKISIKLYNNKHIEVIFFPQFIDDKKYLVLKKNFVILLSFIILKG